VADQSSQDVVKNLFATALEFHRQGRLKEAETLYRQIVQRVPDHFDALYWLGLIHLGRGDAETGIVFLSQALRSRPDSADALIYLGHALNMQRHYEEALASFDKALAIKPNLPVALNNRGLALHGLERFEQAIASFDKALALDPAFADALNNRGITLQKLDKREDALASFARALALRPNYPEALSNCGKALSVLGRNDEALVSYDRALVLKPHYHAALHGKGVVLQALRHHEEAVACYQEALALKTDDPDTFNNLGVALLKTKRYTDALANCEQALALKPDFHEVYSNRGAVLLALGRDAEALAKTKHYTDALANCEQALALRPDFHEAFSNRGAVLLALGRYAEALASIDQALALKPDFVEALINRGNTLQALQRHAEAIESYRRAVAITPGYPGALYNESLAHLCLGDFQAGWEQYEFRWTREDAPEQRPFKSPKWLGGDAVVGKRLLLWAEQGLGDTIQFCRYAPILARKGVEVVLEVPSPLKALLGTLEGVTAITTDAELPPAHDYHCPLLSLPLALRSEISGIPNDVPYLAATPDKFQTWKRMLEKDSEPKVGIVCSGNPGHMSDRNRSIPLRQFSPLLETGASFYLLQTECRPEDEAFLSETSRIRDLRQRLTAFTETAAVIACLDLVICVDTSVAHLAGALGKPVWILLPFSPDWRWMLDREDSPWYPTARLFRQTEMGDWQGVIERVREALSRRVGVARRAMEVISLP
jgi:tetratricopeptide (TPR) repeat protein